MQDNAVPLREPILSSLRLILLILAALLAGGAFARTTQAPTTDSITLADLPHEARVTFILIRRGGPFPYRKDGSVFGNFERRLPIRTRGYYREYTVPTPGAHGRGARRIVTGQSGRREVESPSDYYYTDDHYRSFRKIVE